MSPASATIPVFILGIQRSGTTWVANLLAAHPAIAAVKAERHHGVHESVYFSHFARCYGPWEDASARARFLKAFLASDYFSLTGLDPTGFADTDARSYAAFFREVMDRFAADNDRHIWLEKSPHHTLLGDELAKAYPDAVFICIIRPTMDLLRSRLWSFGRTPPPYPKRLAVIARACVSNAFHRRSLVGFAARHARAFSLDYADLSADPLAALAPLWPALKLDPPEKLESAFAANTSFGSATQRKRALTATDRAVARAFIAAVTLVPQSILIAAHRLITTRRKPVFPRWVWRTAESYADHAPSTKPQAG
ncbi:MAG: sulfotransferase [Pseudomonadota bacterium]